MADYQDQQVANPGVPLFGNESRWIEAALQFAAKLLICDFHANRVESTNHRRHARILSRIGNVLSDVVAH